MSKYSRRDFMVQSAVAGAMALQAEQLLAAEAPAGPAADMAIARWKGPEITDPTDSRLAEIALKLTNQAMAGLGGMARFVKKGGHRLDQAQYRLEADARAGRQHQSRGCRGPGRDVLRRRRQGGQGRRQHGQSGRRVVRGQRHPGGRYAAGRGDGLSRQGPLPGGRHQRRAAQVGAAVPRHSRLRPGD